MVETSKNNCFWKIKGLKCCQHGFTVSQRRDFRKALAGRAAGTLPSFALRFQRIREVRANS